ncbi:MAG: hypothetical protein GY786_22780, partial [Proteobacteria bacterium]|nr:hypothetical protein [Pseudomonadota bacterium]
FSQFFIAPTFDLQFVEREINAVNSEHQKNIKNDFRRSYQVIRSLANPAHPFHKFGTGNLQTLVGDKIDYTTLRNQLIQFYQEHYSASNMKLVILGKESLDQLEQYANKYFNPISNKKGSTAGSTYPPLFSAQLPRIIKIKPIKTIRSLQLMFELPSQITYYQHKPLELIAQLIGDEGVGSILAYLKKRGWATSLSAGAGGNNRDYSLFNIRISLTNEGRKYTDEIIAVVFKYIEIIKKQQNLKLYFEEAKTIAANDFRFKEKETPYNLVSSLASKLHYIPKEHVLAVRWMYDDYREDLTTGILSRLNYANLQVILTDPQVETDSIEKWYKTPYKVQAYNYNENSFEGDKPDLSLPPKNIFIAEKVGMQPVEYIESVPLLMEEGSNIKVWFQQDPSFNTPKGNLRISLSTSDAYSDVTKAAMTRLFTMMLKENLNQFSYPASLAGLHYSISNSVKGIEITLSGYPENLPLLFKKIVETAKNLEIDHNNFQIQKNRLKESRMNQKFSQAFHRATYELHQLLSDPLWHTDDYLGVIDQITPEQQQAFQPELLDNTIIEILAYGNFSIKGVQQIAKQLKSAFQQSEGDREKTIIEKTVALPQLKPFIYRFPIEDLNTAVLLYFQSGPQNTKQSVTINLLQQIIEKPFYYQLRTMEQLGYIVWSGQRKINKIDGMYFLVQSGNQSASHLQERIETFLINFRKKLSQLSKAEFENFRESTIARKKEQSKTLNEATNVIWQVIDDRSYDFKVRENEIEALYKITQGEVMELYDRLFISSTEKSSLFIQALGKNQIPPEDKEEYLIKNTKQFKTSMNFYDNPTGETPKKGFSNGKGE